MKYQDQVVSLELAQKMKELGFEQELNHGDWAWCMCERCVGEEIHLLHDDNDEGNFVGNDYQHRFSKLPTGTFVKAYTVAELGEILKNFGTNTSWPVYHAADNMWHSYHLDHGSGELDGRTEANARAKLLIHLKEKF